MLCCNVAYVKPLQGTLPGTGAEIVGMRAVSQEGYNTFGKGSWVA